MVWKWNSQLIVEASWCQRELWHYLPYV